MHQIRLRGPWLKSVAQQSDSSETSKSFNTHVPELSPPCPASDLTHAAPKPADATAGGDAVDLGGKVHYERRFNWPTGTGDSTRMWLRLEHWCGQPLRLSVNGHSLELTAPPLEAEITPYLTLHNRIELTLQPGPSTPPALDGEVSLLIVEDEGTDRS